MKLFPSSEKCQGQRKTAEECEIKIMCLGQLMQTLRNWSVVQWQCNCILWSAVEGFQHYIVFVCLYSRQQEEQGAYRKKSNGTQQSKTQNCSFFLYSYDRKSEFTWKWTLWTPENIKAARNHWKILACYYSYPIKMSLLIITCKYTHDVHGAVISSGGSAMLIWVCNGRFAVCWQYSAAQRDQTAGGDGDDFVWSLAGL